MLAYVMTTVYQFEWWHLPAGVAVILIIMTWLGIYASGFLTALDISRRCANSARNRGLDARYYACIGALYSILSIGLGIYLVRKLQGTPTSSSTIRAYYAILFVAWLAIIVLGLLSFDSSSMLSILMVPVGIPLCMTAIVLLLMKPLRTSTGNSYSTVLPAFTYILPFVFSFLSSTIPGLLLMYKILAEG